MTMSEDVAAEMARLAPDVPWPPADPRPVDDGAERPEGWPIGLMHGRLTEGRLKMLNSLSLPLFGAVGKGLEWIYDGPVDDERHPARRQTITSIPENT